jgi:hypothetical protein
MLVTRIRGILVIRDKFDTGRRCWQDWNKSRCTWNRPSCVSAAPSRCWKNCSWQIGLPLPGETPPLAYPRRMSSDHYFTLMLFQS